jgi:hypothetical protein
MGWLDLRSNGYAVLTARADVLEATVFTLHESFVSEKRLSEDFESHFGAIEFRIAAGSRNLEQNIDGAWRRWDMTEMRWV